MTTTLTRRRETNHDGTIPMPRVTPTTSPLPPMQPTTSDHLVAGFRPVSTPVET
jgi:hypothetical protein